MQIAMGLDFGSTTLSAVAIDQHGNQLASCTVAHKSDVANLPENQHEQDPHLLYDKALSVLRQLSDSPDVDVESVTCLGITGQMHGILLADQKGQPLTNLMTWQDRRVLECMDRGTFLDHILEQVGDQFASETGCHLRPGFGGLTLSWLAQKKLLPDVPFRCCTIMDWFAARLIQHDATSLNLQTDRSNAASLGLFNFNTDSWHTRLLETLHLQAEWLPEVKNSGEPIGSIRSEIANKCGLPKNVQVCVPLGDHQAAVLGSGGMAADTVHINIGTGGQICWLTDQIQVGAGVETRYLPQNQLMIVGAGQVGGRAFEWLAKTAQSWLQSFGVTMSLDEAYQRIREQMDKAPQNEGQLHCEPFFNGTRQTPDRRGSFGGISEDNFSPGNAARAIIAGIVEAFYEFHAAHSESCSPQRIIATGNAIQKIPELPRALAERFQTQVFTPQNLETAATGAAILAGAETSIWSDLKTALGKVNLYKIQSPKS